MKTRKVNVGNVMGLSSYQLAVLSGKFTGSLEEYLEKEQKYFDDTVSYVDDVKARIEDLLASVIDSGESGDLSEIINARGDYTLLGQRLNATDEQLQVILNKLNQLDPDTINVDAIRVIGADRNVELRNTGVVIEWRQINETAWHELAKLEDITPNIQIGNVNISSNPEEVKASITGTRRNPLLNLTLPKGKDGVDGGSIINMTTNENGEGIITVCNPIEDEEAIEDEEGNIYLIPHIEIGTVETLEHTESAYATLTGTSTNLKLNLGIPKGKPCSIKRAKVNTDGWLEFESE